MRRLQLMLTLALGIAIPMTVPVAANGPSAVLFDTFGPEDTYNNSVGWGIGSDLDSACQFTITAATPHYLDTIELAANMTVGTNLVDVWLASDVAGEPGAMIEGFSFDGAMGPLPFPNPPLAANSILRPILYPDTPYWLVVGAPAPDTSAIWNWSLPPIQGTIAQREGLGPWLVWSEWPLGAFRITGSVVPPPATSIEEILDFIDECMEDGTLAGSGPGKSAENRLNALVNMLEEAQRLIEDGLLQEACQQLRDAYKKCDGQPKPPDFVTGVATEQLASMIEVVIDSLGCE